MQAEDWEDPDRQNQDAYDELLAAIEASENQLSLLIAVCNDPGLQAEIIQRYETDLSPTFHHDRLTLARGEPSLKAAINQAIAEDEALQQDGKAVLTLTGIEQLHFLSFGEEKSEQDIFFGYLQWTREALREFQFPIVIWVTYQILAQLSRKSPDFWSWRRGVFRFVSRKTTAVHISEFFSLRHKLKQVDFDDNALLPLNDLKTMIQKAEQRNPKDSSLAMFYRQMGQIYAGRLERGEIQDYQIEQAQAIEYFQKAIDLQEESGQGLDLANSLGKLAIFYTKQGRYREAEPLYKRALSIEEQQLGYDHPELAVSLLRFALFYEVQGCHLQAKSLYKQSVEIWERYAGSDYTYGLISIISFVLLHTAHGNYTAAESLLQYELAIQEKLGNYSDIANSLDTLAWHYQTQGYYTAAEPLFWQALVIREQQLGHDHLDIADSLHSLALLYYAQKQYTEAEPLHKRALSIREKQLGHDHPDITDSLYGLAFLYDTQQRFVEAEPLHKRALSIREKQLGHNHLDVATSLMGLGLHYMLRNHVAEAEPILQKALAIREQQLGVEHPDTIRAHEQLQIARSHLQKNRSPHSL